MLPAVLAAAWSRAGSRGGAVAARSRWNPGAVSLDRVPPANTVKANARIHRSLAALVSGALLLIALGGCQLKHPTDNLVHGKQLFVAKCGACHALSHAQTTGTIGPNLDTAFSQGLSDGMKRNDIRGIVNFQVLYPNPQGAMPAMLFKGKAAGDVAGYVAAVAAAPGQDTGPLASAVASVSQKAVTEQNGKIEIDADPTGQLKFLASSATAKPGPVTLRSVNKSSVPHDIAITGGSVNQIGPVVQNGGVSTVSTTLQPGTYTFYCSVPGHRQAGMQGTLTVK
jgi:plastocyanin